jgi:cytochrome c biogenesis protein CcmG, thiol:disulfide interchange protein DsbE
MEKFKGPLILAGGLLFGLLLGAMVLWGGGSSQGSPSAPPAAGKSVPDFTLTSLDGKRVHLSELKGKAVVINFWATWCPPCREEMPLLEVAAKKYQDQVLFLAVDDNEDQAQVRDYIQKMGLDLTVLLDPDGKINELYFVQSYPNTFFIDADGILRAQRVGQLDEAILRRNLEAIGINP